MSRPRLEDALRIGMRLLRRAGWAPIGVLVFHVVVSHGFRIYERYPNFDVVTHFLGGLSAAWFVSSGFRAIPEPAVPRGPTRAALEAISMVTITAMAAVFWEFFEYLMDHVFHTRMGGGLADTLGDEAVGITGALAWTFVAWRRGALGRVVPLDPAPRR